MTPAFSTRDPPPPTGKTAHLAAKAKNRKKPTAICVVDHDDAVRDALSLTLRSCGFDVHAYGSARDLLNRLPMRREDCFLIEFDLKDMTGNELLKRLYKKQIELPTIIMSARLRPLILEMTGPPGIMAILQKPFGEDALLHCLERVLATRQ